MNTMEPMQQSVQNGRKPPVFFREEYIGFIVKGNFMTLAAKPALVEEGEWLSHQGKSRLETHDPPTHIDAIVVVEQNRLLSGMVKIVQTEDRSNGVGLCNEKSCPTMSAGG